jgi:hypothetical protein
VSLTRKLLKTPFFLHHKDILATAFFISLEVISKRSIGLKIKAEQGGQPQTYTGYFEDWPPCSNTEIEFEGTF